MVQGRAHSGRSWERGLRGAIAPLPETKHLHTCQSIFNFACNLVHERFEDAKNQSAVTFSPHPPLYQLEANYGNLVSSWL